MKLFDFVQENSYEVTYDEVAKHYGGPMSKHPVINVKGHPETVWVRPDMGIGMVAHGMTFGIGEPMQQIPWREVRRSRARGYLPIIISTWSKPPLLYTQTAFAILLGANSVRSGHEKQVVMIEMDLRNTDLVETNSATLWFFVPCTIPAKGIPPFPYCTYDLFEIVGGLPALSGPATEPPHNLLRDGTAAVGLYRADDSIRVACHKNAFRFNMNLGPGQNNMVRLLLSSSAEGLSDEHMANLQALDFSSALDQRILDLETILHEGTQIDVPEPVVNHIYKAQILDVHAQLLQGADKAYCVPVQGYQGVWPWEAMKLATHLDSIGYHRDVRRCLEYFLQIQDRFPPHGNYKSSKGVFGGTYGFEESGWETDDASTLYGQQATLNKGKEGQFPNWMNGTGAILYIFGNHYLYTKDREWLQRVSPALVRACDWIISERQATKQQDSQGNKVLHYGLLPIGRAYDTAEEAIQKLTVDGELPEGKTDDRHAPLDTYYPCWTDSYSSQGLTAVAEALAEIGHPEGERLLMEAKVYRDDILEVMRRTRMTAPNLPPYPERLYRPPAWAEFATGCLSYVDTGFLDPRSPEFEQLEAYMKVKWNRGVVGLTGGLDKNGDAYATDSFYVNFSEDIWHRGWLLRAEVEKALLAFYSMLAYGMDKQTLITVERFHLYDQRYAPFFMDTSESPRVCGLIRQALLFEAGDTVYLLAGAPRRWLEARKKIEVRHGITTAAKLNLTVQSEVDQDKILVEIVCSYLIADRKLRLRVPHPSRLKMKQVRLNGNAWSGFESDREEINFTLQPGRSEFVVLY